MFLYETHCHTKESSLCARNSASEVVEFYLSKGYTGIFVTDHFINGNARVNRERPNAPYKEKVEEFFLGYEEVKKAAKDKLDVFFGVEMSYKGTDVLLYNVTKEWLLDLDEEHVYNMRKMIRKANEDGIFTVQAHPFREDSYIDHIRLFPDVQGVETFNANRNELCNSLGDYYAEQYKKPKLGGSDLHWTTQKLLSGMAFEKRLESAAEFVELVKDGKGQIIKMEL